MAVGQLSDLDILALVTGTHADPFAVLGVHRAGRHTIVRAFAPTAHDLTVTERDGQPLAAMQRLHAAGLFEARLPARKGTGPLRFEARGEASSWAFIDAYGFGPVLGPMDDHFAAEGSHLRLFDRLGAHVMTHEGVSGVHFAVWAPNARRVSVVGDFNQWDGRRHIMRFRRGSGIWEIFVPDVGSGALYKYELIGAEGRLALKSDPYAFAGELRPGNASVVAQIDTFAWSDGAYLEERARRDPRRSPVSIYEVHAGSWRRPGGGFPSWSDLAETLIPYVRDMGFSHIELLPVSEHPLDASWGYQPTGLFAPTARFGSPEGFAGFVDAAHAAGLGVILDWVPAHFPTDAHGLARFDGTALYEHADPRQGFHPDWNTAIYNFGRREVANFLINNALFWLEKYHVDGLRVDAVASMLYLDYSRKAGEWIANREGGRENLDAIDFLKALNRTVYAAHPSVLMIAEESTSFPGVTQPVHAGGLGFGFKWNMGFMHDTLRYLKREPVHRKHHHADLTFGLLYAFSENFVLPLSHDEVVHGKASLLHKMTGDDWQKFASLRAYYAFMWGYPGKKLLFMGQEFGQRREWSEERELDWTLLGHAPHGGLSRLVRDLNGLYGTLPALHARDCESEGFAWLVVDDAARSTVAFVRRGGEAAEPVVVVSNFTPVPRPDYLLPMPAAGRWRECLNSDAGDYGGSGIGNLGVVTAEGRPLDGQPARARLHLPPLATLILARG